MSPGEQRDERAVYDRIQPDDDLPDLIANRIEPLPKRPDFRFECPVAHGCSSRGDSARVVRFNVEK